MKAITSITESDKLTANTENGTIVKISGIHFKRIVMVPDQILKEMVFFVFKSCKKINTTSAVTQDEFISAFNTPSMLKECCIQISGRLSAMFSQGQLQQGHTTEGYLHGETFHKDKYDWDLNTNLVCSTIL